jgi:disulfide bond formation protein DsbB
MIAKMNRRLSSSLATLGMAFTVGSALAFEHIGGYIPCALCLLQRDPYYYAIPLGAVAMFLSFSGKLPALQRILLVIIAIAMLIGAGIGAFHAGVEWGFWEGPASCAGAQAVTTNAGSLLDALNSTVPPSCGAASLRVLGLSFAGWNVIASLVLAAIALIGARSHRV